MLAPMFLSAGHGQHTNPRCGYRMPFGTATTKHPWVVRAHVVIQQILQINRHIKLNDQTRAIRITREVIGTHEIIEQT
jgi:hypothetical protein